MLTTQYLEEADRLADRIAVIDGGRVVAEGTAAELKARLGSTIVHVGLPDPAIAVRAREVLKAFGPAELTNGHSVEVKVDDGARALVEIVRRLDRDNIDIDAITVREPTLDDVFLTFTGHKSQSSQQDNHDAEATDDATPTRSRRARRRTATRGAA
jgi:ABC-2 type transport system ATP-binding protein